MKFLFPFLFILHAGICVAESFSAFPIGGLSGLPDRDKAAGFTIAGPTYQKDQPAFLKACETAGLLCVYSIGAEVNFLSRLGETTKTLDKEAIRLEIVRQVREVADSPAIHCWRLNPSELRPWRPLEMEYLRIAVEAIQSADPKKRPVYNYQPGHRTQEGLEKVLPFQGLATKGVYPNYSGRRNERAWVTWTIEQQAAAIRTAQPGAIPYAVLEMYLQPKDDFPLEDIPRWVRHDAYAALSGGVRGILIYSFGRRSGFHPGIPEWETYYQAWSGVAQELNGPHQLGMVFLKGNPITPPDFTVLEGPAYTLLSGSKAGPLESTKVPSFSSVAYQWQNAKYWILVNSNNLPITLKLNAPLKAMTPLLVDQPTFLSSSSIRLPGLGVAVFRIPEIPMTP